MMQKNNHSKNAIVTYIYSSALPYFTECLKSIKEQSNKDFDVIIFSDNVNKVQIEHTNIEFELIPLAGTPLEIRFKSLEYLKVLPFQKYIFIDADDTMSKNRVAVCLNGLDYYSIVCNDLSIMNERGEISIRNIWQDRLSDKFVFNSKFILDKNIVGFGSTAIRKEVLELPIKLHKSPVASDWFIFYQIMKLSKKNTIFTSECQTNYRQHQSNNAGIRKTNAKRILYVIEVKKKHYQALLELGYDEVLPYYNELNLVELNNLTFANVNGIGKYPFWWEESNFINTSL